MKSITSILLAINAVQTLGAAIAPALNQNVTLSSGEVLGNSRDANGILSFLGVPYAQPPVGNLRWQSPQTLPNSHGIFNATAFGSSCYASTNKAEPYFTPPSENCLFLNIWTGAQTASEKRPVMFWIPGGGFQFGSGARPTYRGANLAMEGVIIVTINYRLGVFGFLALSELDKEGPRSSGDFGLQDQLAALAWVKSNIAAFGGDPDNVTIFGESAGAHAVGLLMSSPLSKGMFNKAIMESGAFWDSEAGPLETFAQARQRGAAFEGKLGATSVAQLRAISATDINNAAQWNPMVDPKIAAFAPGIDNYVLSENAGMVFQNSQQMKVPLLAGFNSDEQAAFLPYGLSQTSATAYQTGLMDYFVPQALRALMLYPDSTAAQLADSAQNLIGDMVIREQTYTALSTQYSTAGLPANSIWAYYFTYTSPYSPAAIHTAEIPFVFGNLGPNPAFGPGEAPPSSADVAFSKTVMGYWTNFAKTGNPNGNGLPAWPAYTGGGSEFLQLGSTITPITYDLSRLQFLASFRLDGVLPESWRSVNVSSIGN